MKAKVKPLQLVVMGFCSLGGDEIIRYAIKPQQMVKLDRLSIV